MSKCGKPAVKTGGMVAKGSRCGVYKCPNPDSSTSVQKPNVALKEYNIPKQDEDGRDAFEGHLQALMEEFTETLLPPALPVHPHLVQYVGLEYVGGKIKGDMGRLLITVEWVEGAKKTKGPLQEPQAQHVARCLVDAIAELHGKNVTHDDIRPCNVFVVADFEHYNPDKPDECPPIVKVADYSIFKKLNLLFDPIGGQATIKQSPQYMAPEVFTDGNSYDPFKVDVWGIGATILELLSGKPPFAELDPTGKFGPNLMFKIVGSGKPPAYPSGISDDCKKFLDACFEREFERKRPSVDELKKHPWIA